MKKILPVVAFIAIIAAISVICVMLNNVIFVAPRDQANLDISTKVVGVLEKQNADIYMLESDVDKFQEGILKQVEINQKMYYYFKNRFNFQESVNSTMFELIIDQEKRIQTLERRHLEVLRAICILQKKHYPEKFQIPNIEEIKKLEKSETINTPKIMEEVEKVLQQWDEAEKEKN